MEFVLENGVWVLEGQGQGKGEGEGEEKEYGVETRMNQSVLVRRVSNGRVRIRGKCNRVSVHECEKVDVEVDSMVSNFEIVKSRRCGVRINEQGRMVNVEGCVDCVVGIAGECEILMIGSQGINVTRRREGEEEEIYLPEQIKVSFGEDGTYREELCKRE